MDCNKPLVAITRTIEWARDMKMYFFDLATLKGCSYDYKGQALANAQEARRLAELIALDLASTTAFDWIGTVVKVSDASGAKLFSVPVIELEAIAA